VTKQETLPKAEIYLYQSFTLPLGFNK